MNIRGRLVPFPPVLPATLLLMVSVLLACLVVLSARLPPALGALVPALVALGVGWALLGRIAAAGRRESMSAAARAATAEARVSDLIRQGSQLRHDLRGILSPAMLTADRLTTNQDPLTRRAAEAMISTVERAEERLRRDQAV